MSEEEHSSSESEMSEEESEGEEEEELSELMKVLHESVGNFGLLFNLITKGEEYYNEVKSGLQEEVHEIPEEWEKQNKIDISEGIELDMKDPQNNGRTLLQNAVMEGELQASKLLLLCGADPNSQDRDLNTSLHLCLISNTGSKVAIYHQLLRSGANFDLKNCDDRSAIDLAVILREESCVRLVVEYGGDISSQYDRDLLRLVKKVANIEEVEETEYNEFEMAKSKDREHKLQMKSRKMQRKKADKRNRKWEKMLSKKNEDGVCTHSKVKKRVRKGVPNELRGEVWRSLLPIQRFKKDNIGLYYDLLKQQTPYTKQIDVDINRTFRNHRYFRKRYGEKQISLFNVLRAYSVYDRELGYCQGMNSIAAILLMYMEDEEDVFWFLVTIMNDHKYDLRGIFLRGFPLLKEAFYMHDRIMEKYLPKLHQHLHSQHCVPDMYATRWYMLFFADILPVEISIRIWEIFFNEGKKVIFSFTFSLLKMLEKKLLKMSFEKIIPHLLHLNEDDLDTEKFVVLSTKNKVKQKVLRKFSMDYQKKLDDEDKRRKKKKRYTYYGGKK